MVGHLWLSPMDDAVGLPANMSTMNREITESALGDRGGNGGYGTFSEEMVINPLAVYFATGSIDWQQQP